MNTKPSLKIACQVLDVRLLNHSGEVLELAFLANDTDILRHILALLHIQGIVREEDTMHPLVLLLIWRSV